MLDGLNDLYFPLSIDQHPLFSLPEPNRALIKRLFHLFIGNLFYFILHPNSHFSGGIAFAPHARARISGKSVPKVPFERQFIFYSLFTPNMVKNRPITDPKPFQGKLENLQILMIYQQFDMVRSNRLQCFGSKESLVQIQSPRH